MRAVMSILAGGIAVGMASAVPAAWAQHAAPNASQQRMKSCNAQASAEKLKGNARQSFMSECLSGAAASAGSTNPQQDKMKSCNAEAKAEKLAGEARKSFMSDCLSGKSRTEAAAPQRGASAPRAERAPAETPPPSAGTSQPPPRATPSPRAGTALAAGQFATDHEAQQHCPGQSVVWANTDSRIYHYAGTKSYGNTKQGAYMCQQDGNRAGFRPAKNEKAPQ